MTKYEFDRVFGMEATQESVYETIGDVALQSLRQGFNSTILAYGQTGSGKTFSMEARRTHHARRRQAAPTARGDR